MALLLVLGLLALAAAPAVAAEPPGRFEVVGSNALFNRGMNAALAVSGDYAYVGSRTDGTHPSAGVLVVDVSRPSSPQVVHQIGPPAEGNPGESSRELRVWRRQGLLIVLNFECDRLGHACAGATEPPPKPNFRFYDIRGDNAARPKLVATYFPSRLPHEFFLWEDPRTPGRALLYISTPAEEGENDEPEETTTDNLLVADVSGARDGRFRELASWNPQIPPDPESEQALHSLTVSNDGTRAYLAYLGGGFFAADTTDFARGVADPKVRDLTPVTNRVRWGDPGAHSALQLLGDRPYVLVTDEVYGRAFGLREELGFNVLRGCPWGWARLIDIRNLQAPRIAGEYKLLPYNDPAYCPSSPPLQDNGSSFSPHNPTALERMAIITWHSGGVQAVDLADPSRPRQLADFRPTPLPAVQTEDPALSSGSEKVVMWSYPIIQDGLVYVVDLRNGLYILRYRGPNEGDVRCVEFLEGNSNQGDAAAPCPIAVRGGPLRASRLGAVSTRVTCPAACAGLVRLERVASRSARPARRRDVRIGLARFAIPARASQTVRVRLTLAGRRVLGRRGAIRVRVNARAQIREGPRRSATAVATLRGRGR